MKPDENYVPFQVHLLLESLDADDDILCQYVSVVVPKMLMHFSTTSAKGGKAFLEKCQRAGFTGYHDKPDQSMVAHILNGIFPIMRIVKELERRNLQRVTETEKKLYLTAYTLHDLDKIVGEKDLYDLKTPESKAHLKQELNRWIEQLAIAEFFPEYASLLEDIIYVIMNTQEKHGVDLLPYNFDALTLDPRKIDKLCELSRLSDLLNYVDSKDDSSIVLTSPANLCLGKPEKPRKILAKLSSGQLHFAYHQLSTVTGLLTNFISNAVMQLMKEQGHLPLLFFPNGVVYLSDSDRIDEKICLNKIYEVAVKKISAACKPSLENSSIGFSRDGKGLKFADFFYNNVFSIPELLGVFNKVAHIKIRETEDSASAKRLTKMLNERSKLNIPESLDIAFEPSVDVDRLAEYCIIVESAIEELLNVEDVDQVIIESLGLKEFLESSRLIRDDGGTKYRWYMIAGKYLLANQGLDPREIDGVIQNVSLAVIEKFQERIEEYEKTRQPFSKLSPYLHSILDINGRGTLEQSQFADEFEQYTSAKKTRNRTRMCAVCSSPYTATKQEETAVPFQPQLYSNKLPLNINPEARGLCDICALEFMLRITLMKTRSQFTKGADFEGKKFRYVYIYPNYYFTPETAKFMANFYRYGLKRVHPVTLTKTLGNFDEFTIKHLMELQDFQVERDDNEDEKDSRFLKMELPKDELATLFFFGIQSYENDPTDTESWITPALLAFTLPMVLAAKVVVSEFPLPLYTTGSDFKETVIFDAPHHFLRHILGNDRFRIDEVMPMLQLLIGAYGMHLDVYSDPKTVYTKPNWSQINHIAERLDSDLLNVFYFLMKWERKSKRDIDRMTAMRYIRVYHLLQQLRKEQNMGIYKGLVEKYCTFYRPRGYNSHTIVRPVSVVIEHLVKSDKQTAKDDVILEIIGELHNALDRVRHGQSKGYAPLFGQEQLTAIREFVEYFYQEIFQTVCRGERGVLRERSNPIKYACEAYYLEEYAKRKAEDEFEEDIEEDEQLSLVQ